MTQFTEFGRDVKKALIDAGETQDWLMKRIKDSTGLFVDNGYIYKILTGQRNAPKIVQAIREILDLPEQNSDTT
ncbi:XRE family transcriptional regulator [Intestinimonas sp.]|uniref:XRE family transcriptional regulator n=1 Tax=Intestinimonas sp. TaxID=1965293 RepID=UPI003AB216DE